MADYTLDDGSIFTPDPTDQVQLDDGSTFTPDGGLGTALWTGAVEGGAGLARRIFSTAALGVDNVKANDFQPSNYSLIPGVDSLVNGAHDLASAFPETAQATRDWLLEQSLKDKAIQNSIEEQYPLNPHGLGLARGALSGLVEYGPTLAMDAATGGAAAGLTGIGNKYYDMIEKGASRSDALKAGGVSGLLDAAGSAMSLPIIHDSGAGLFKKIGALAAVNEPLALTSTYANQVTEDRALGKQTDWPALQDEMAQASLQNVATSTAFGTYGHLASRGTVPHSTKARVDALSDELVQIAHDTPSEPPPPPSEPPGLPPLPDQGGALVIRDPQLPPPAPPVEPVKAKVVDVTSQPHSDFPTTASSSLVLPEKPTFSDPSQGPQMYSDPSGGFITYSQGLNPGEVLITTMQVPQEKQSKGIGSKILKSFTEAAKQNGYDRVVLEAIPDQGVPQEKLNRFYQKNGFSATGDGAEFAKSLVVNSTKEPHSDFPTPIKDEPVRGANPAREPMQGTMFEGSDNSKVQDLFSLKAGEPDTPSQPSLANAEPWLYDKRPISWMSPHDIVDMPEVPNFKAEYNASDKLQGPYIPNPSNALAVLIRDVTNEPPGIITGRNRRGAARVTPGEPDVPIQSFRQSEGFTYEHARRMDAEANIKDGNGKISDYARFFKREPTFTKEVATERGLLGLEKGQIGFAIGKDSSESTYSLHQAGKLTDGQALAIATGAPGDSTIQEIGIAWANEKTRNKRPAYLPDELHEMVKELARKVKSGEIVVPPDASGDQIDWLKNSPAAKAIAAEAKVATEFAREETAKITTNEGLLKLSKKERADLVSKQGEIKLDSREKTKADLEAALTERDRWHEWRRFPDLKAKVAEGVKKLFKNQKGAQNIFNDPAEKITKVIPDSVKEAIQHTGDKALEYWNHYTGRDVEIDHDLSLNEKFLQGHGPTLLPPILTSALRKGLIFPETFANRSTHFSPIFEIGKRTLGNEREVIQRNRDTLRPYSSLSKEQRAPLDELLIAMRIGARKFADKHNRKMPELTTAQLLDRGLSMDQVRGYKAVRLAANQNLEITRGTLKAYTIELGKQDRADAWKDIDDYIDRLKDTFYVPFSRERGDYAVKVTGIGPQGKEVTEFYTTHKTSAEAERQKAALIKEGRKAETFRLSKEIPEELSGLPLDVKLALSGVNPEILKGGESLAGFRARLKSAHLVEGNNPDLAVALGDYGLSIARWSSRVWGEKQFQQAYGKIPLSERSTRNYSARYWADIKKGASPVGTAMTRAMNLYNLAGVPSAGLVNTTQIFTTAASKITSKNFGGWEGGSKALTRAINEGALYMRAPEKFGEKSAYHHELAVGLNDAVAKGHIEAQSVTDLHNMAQGIEGDFNSFDFLMNTFGLPEKYNRIVSYIAAFDIATQKGMKGDVRAEFADKFVTNTQFDQSMANRPQWARGATGRIMFQYKLFQGHMLRFIRDSIAEKDYHTAGMSLGAMVMFAGVRGLPAAAAILGLVEALFDVDFNKNIRKIITNQTAADGFIYGVPAASGINISTAAGMGDVVPNIDQQWWKAAANLFLGPVAQVPIKLAKSVEAYNKDAPWNAVENAVPRFMRGPIKALEYGMTGKVSDMNGDPLLEEKDPLTKAYQMGTIALGFSPTDYTREYEYRTAQNKYKQTAQDNEDINLRMAKAIKNQDRAKINDIIKESLDSLKLSPEYYKPLSEQGIGYWLHSKLERDVSGSPTEIKGGMIALDKIYHPERYKSR